LTPDNVKPLQRFYKGVLLIAIHKELNRHNKFTKSEIDHLLKHLSDLNKSTMVMNLEEIKSLVEWSLVHCSIWGVNVDYPEDEIDLELDLNFNRTELKVAA
tara:strand:- start:67 stop:369 length:303 start_codon:yes stop_codon:yes gene_type:complete